MTDIETVLLELRQLKTEMHAHFDGIKVAIAGLRRDYRDARGAINNFAHNTVTRGEIESLHTDVDEIQTTLLDIAARLAVVEAHD